MNLEKLQKTFLDIITENFTADSFSGISDSEWRSLFDFACENRCSALLYSILRKNHIHLPVDVDKDACDVYQSACSIDFRRKKELKELVKLLNDNQVENLLLKGSHLIFAVYDDSYCRITSDIDLLVRKEDGLKAYELLLANGYHNTFTGHEKLKDDFNQHYPPLYKAKYLPVEIHTYLSNDYKVNLKGIWDRSQVLKIGHSTTRIMCPEDLIMHIAMHKFVTDTSLCGLQGLFDISKVIERHKINWSLLRELVSATEYDNEKCLFLVLHLCGRLFGTEVDNDLLNSIKPSTFNDELEQIVCKLLFADLSRIDKDAFIISLNAYESRKTGFSSSFSRVFMSPYKIAMYGQSVYGKVDFSSTKLIFIQIKRIFRLLKRYGGFFLKKMLSRHKNLESMDLGENCAKIKYWLTN